jgi:transposase InsO family protein
MPRYPAGAQRALGDRALGYVGCYLAADRCRIHRAIQLLHAEQVRRVFADSRQTFGCRRVAAQLNREGHECSVGLVADLMRELGLTAVQPRGYKRTTLRGEQPVQSEDLIGGDFDPGSSSPGERLSETSPTSTPARAGSTWPP